MMTPLRPDPASLPQTIPLFPLPGALLLPRARLPLHIFEPRYLAMVEECLRSPHRLIGMICPIGTPLQDPQPEGSRLSQIGCAGRLVRFAEHEDGRMAITLAGISRFRLRAEVEGFTPWRRGEVDWSPFPHDIGQPETDPGLDREALLALVRRKLGIRGLSMDLTPLAQAGDEELIHALCVICPLPPEDRQALLEAPGLSARRQTLTTLIEFDLHRGSGDEVLQ